MAVPLVLAGAAMAAANRPELEVTTMMQMQEGQVMSDAELAELGDVPSSYSGQVGDRLRAIRRQKRLSLQDVEISSGQEFKASVLGAYERGERAISVPRLQRLARFYNVPVDQLLPADEGPEFGATAKPPLDADSVVTIDLRRLGGLTGPEAAMLNRYLTMIQVQRQDFNGRVLTIRRDDLRAIACILGVGVDTAPSRLEDLGLSLTK